MILLVGRDQAGHRSRRGVFKAMPRVRLDYALLAIALLFDTPASKAAPIDAYGLLPSVTAVSPPHCGTDA
jgi:hypothetical protein